MIRFRIFFNVFNYSQNFMHIDILPVVETRDRGDAAEVLGKERCLL